MYHFNIPPPTDHSYWAKDIVFVISDGYLDGMQAWLGAYHGLEQYGEFSYICHWYNYLAFSRSASRATKSIFWRNLDCPQYRLPWSFIFTSRGIFRSVSSIKTGFLMSKICQKRGSQRTLTQPRSFQLFWANRSLYWRSSSDHLWSFWPTGAITQGIDI